MCMHIRYFEKNPYEVPRPVCGCGLKFSPPLRDTNSKTTHNLLPYFSFAQYLKRFNHKNSCHGPFDNEHPKMYFFLAQSFLTPPPIGPLLGYLRIWYEHILYWMISLCTHVYLHGQKFHLMHKFIGWRFLWTKDQPVMWSTISRALVVITIGNSCTAFFQQLYHHVCLSKDSKLTK